MSAHASQAFSIAHCTDSEDLPALSRISPRVRVRVRVSIVHRIASGGYSWIWPICPTIIIKSSVSADGLFVQKILIKTVS